MAGKVDAKDVILRNSDANTAFQLHITQPDVGIIKTATILLNTEMKWYSEKGREEIFESIGFYASVIMESERFVGTNTLFQIDCYKIIKGELVEYRDGQTYLRRKGKFNRIRIDKYGTVTLL